jgi:hypothetical protein
MTILFDNTYARLPERFFAKQAPARVPEAKLIRLNLGLAAKLRLDADWLQSAVGVAMLAMPFPRAPIRSRKRMPATSSADSYPNLETAAPCFWAKSSTRTARVTTCN